MNAFAESLFTLLLGWVRGLARIVFDVAASGGAQSALVWLGDHWLPLVIALCLIGVAADFAVWLLRWQPYLVWGTKLRHLSWHVRRRQVSARRFDKGYEDAVAFHDAIDPEPAPIQPPPLDYEEEWAYAKEPEPPPGQRRRRSEKHREKAGLLQKIKSSFAAPEEEGLLDSLPPAIDKDQAFREPVYPLREDSIEWKQQNNPPR